MYLTVLEGGLEDISCHSGKDADLDVCGIPEFWNKDIGY